MNSNKVQECKCESWCYCMRESIQKNIDKLPSLYPSMIIDRIAKVWKHTSAGKYDRDIDNFLMKWKRHE